MAVLRCPNCGKPNPDFLEVCQYCDQPLQAGAAAPAAAAPAPPASGKSGIIRCPNCGKPNPSFLAECQFCEQPLGTEGGLSVSEAAIELPADPTESIWGAPPKEGLKDEPDWLWGGGSEAEPAAPAASAAADIPDWLQGAAPAAPSTGGSALPDWLQPESAPTPSGPAASNTPDWLGDVGLAPAAAQAAEDDVPDWLRSLRGEAAPAAPAAPPAPTAAAAPDWLQASAPPFADSGASDDLPDWMKPAPSAAPAKPTAAVPSAAPAKPAAAAPSGTDDLPDWMRASAAPSAAAASSGTDDLPDWMKPAPSAAPSAIPAKPAATAPSGTGDLPDWMKPAPSAAAAASGTDDLPDWMRASAAPSAAPAKPTAAPPPAADDGIPDWMKAAPSATPAKPAATAPSGTGDLPDWMKPAPSAAAAASGTDDLPDWMRASAAPSAAPAKPAAAPPPAADEGLPDWMRAGAEPAPALASDAGGTMPDWLSEGAEPAPSTAAGGSGNVPDWLQSGADITAISGSGAAAGALPDWLSAGAEPAPAAYSSAPSGPPDWLEPGPGEATPPAADPFAAPDWLTSGTETSGAAESAYSSTPSDSFGSGEYSWDTGSEPATDAASSDQTGSDQSGSGDWLAGLRTSTQKAAEPEASPGWLQTLRSAPIAEATPIPEAAPGLEHGALPNWLEAMRPTDVEGGSDHPDDAYQESVGILAGIRGILRAEPVVAKPTKSTTVVHKITLTDAQSKQITLIEASLREAAEPKPVPKRRTSWQPMVERLLVFTFILVAIVLPLFAPGFFAAPAGIDRDTREAFTVVESLPADGVAVVAFDYDVAQRGELDPAAVAIVSHLLRQNVRVLTLSTRPTGVGAAEAVLATAKTAARTTVSQTVSTPFTATYESGFHYLNLGYLPGGPIGIANFTRNPGSVFINDFARSFPPEYPIWVSARALKGVVNLNSVNLIVVIADTADGVRAWIEQAHPQVRSVPIVVVASASAEPLVRPYLTGWGNERPVDGLVVGLAGAAKYEIQSGQPGTAQRDWGPMSGGLLAAAVLLVGGNLVFGSLNLLRRFRKN